MFSSDRVQKEKKENEGEDPMHPAGNSPGHREARSPLKKKGRAMEPKGIGSEHMEIQREGERS
jgi:hypothetical protein